MHTLVPSDDKLNVPVASPRTRSCVVRAEPAVLFLDEPTTGLASAAAFSVVGYISKLASQTGVVCIMTIHQASIKALNRWLAYVRSVRGFGLCGERLG